jgi:hypothetical protein
LDIFFNGFQVNVAIANIKQALTGHAAQVYQLDANAAITDGFRSRERLP